MSLRKAVAGIGGALTLFGFWTLARAHSQVGVCAPLKDGSKAAVSGIDSLCVKTLMAYSEGFVFVASGVIVILIAFTMIARRQRFDRRGELRAVPRTWAKIKYVVVSEDEDPLSADTAAAVLAAQRN